MMTTDLSVQAHTVDAVTFMAVRGELDLATTDAVRLAAERAAYKPSCAELRIDLAGVAFCDMSGLVLRLELRERCRERGIELVLEGVPWSVFRLIDFAGLDGFFQIES